MENQLENVEKILVAVGVLLATLASNGVFPGWGDVLSQDVINAIISALGGFLGLVQFFRNPESTEPEVGVNSIPKFNTVLRHTLIPWSKRKVA